MPNPTWKERALVAVLLPLAHILIAAMGLILFGIYTLYALYRVMRGEYAFDDGTIRIKHHDSNRRDS